MAHMYILYNTYVYIYIHIDASVKERHMIKEISEAGP